MPEITFGNNLVSLKRRGKQRALDAEQASEPDNGVSIVFNGLDALAQVDTTGEDTIKVAYADKWAKSRNLDSATMAVTGGQEQGTGGSNGNPTVIETVKDYDWTYSTRYSGTVGGHAVRLCSLLHCSTSLQHGLTYPMNCNLVAAH